MKNRDKRILIIDDDVKLCSLLARFLKERGYTVIYAHDGRRGIMLLQSENPSLILLDVMLPGEDGFEILRKIRTDSSVPVIMLTARGETTDRIVGLELGADDYIPKPFEPAEMEARIRAVLRRSAVLNGVKGDGIVEFSGFKLDTARRCLIRDDTDVELSALEYRLLEYFAHNPNRVLSRDQITESLHGDEFDSFNRAVDILISRLRKKLDDNPKHPEIIKTVHGHGYMFISRQ